MIKLFEGLVPYLVPKPKIDVPKADNLTFRLHYQVTKEPFSVHSNVYQ